MKRNLIPLLAVAFVVAVASTGIFYGLFVGKLKSAPSRSVVVAAKPLQPGGVLAKADLTSIAWAGADIPKGMFANAEEVAGQVVMQPIEQGEPVLASRLASKNGTGTGIPAGMRAVSVHVSDSSGVLAMLKPGHKVDVQVFAKPSQPGAESEARTAFQNVPVLSVSSQAEPSSLGGFNAPVVTLLVTPKEADALGLADSFGRIRLALRNPLDEGRESKPSLALNALFRGNAVASPQPPPAETRNTAATRSVPGQVNLAVELLSASPEAMNKLRQYGVNTRRDVLDTSQLSRAPELEKVLADLRSSRNIDVLSLSGVNAAVSRTAAVELRGREAGNVRVQFSPFIANGRMKLKVQPETALAGGAPGTRRLETEVDVTGGRSFVISGLKDTTTSAGARELLVLVTPKI